MKNEQDLKNEGDLNNEDVCKNEDDLESKRACKYYISRFSQIPDPPTPPTHKKCLYCIQGGVKM